MVFREFGDFLAGCSQQTCALKIDLFDERAILRPNLERVRHAVATVCAVQNICSEFQVVASQPEFRRELQGWQSFKLVRFSGPVIKEIPAPALGSNFHVRRSLGIGTAVETRVTRNRIEDYPGFKLVRIRDPGGYSSPAIVHGR